VRQSQLALFPQSSVFSEFGVVVTGSQPTLTQMLGVSKKEPTEESSKEGCEVLEILSESFDPDDANQQQKKDGSDKESESLADDEKQSDDDAIDSVLNDSDSEESVPCHRVTWKNGSCNGTTHASDGQEKTSEASAWGALLTTALKAEQEGHYQSGFNRLFAGDSVSDSVNGHDEPGLGHLLELFGSPSSCQSSPAKIMFGTPSPSEKTDNTSPVDLSMLTQRGKALAEDIQSGIATDGAKVADLQVACPEWKENIAYAMNQRDPAILQGALDKVKQSKERMARMKESFLKAWQQQQDVLDLFEMSLNQSRDRLNLQETNSLNLQETNSETGEGDVVDGAILELSNANLP